MSWDYYRSDLNRRQATEGITVLQSYARGQNKKEPL